MSEGIDAAEEFVEAITGERVMDVEPGFVTREPAGFAHDGEVFGDGGEVATNLLVELADAGGFLGEKLCDAKSGGMGESLDDGDAVDSAGVHYLVKVPNTFRMSKRKIPQSEDGGI